MTWFVAQLRNFVNALKDEPAARRMLAFSVALVALLAGAHGGAPRVRVLLFLAVFVVVSTVWVRGQYADDLVGDPWVLPRWVGWLFVVAGALTCGVFLLTQLDGMGLYGLIAIYFGSGTLLMRWRATAVKPGTKSKQVAWRFVAIGLVLYVVGASLLGHANAGLMAGVLALAFLFFLPLALSVFSALAIQDAGEPGRAPSRSYTWGGWIAGAAFVAATATAALLARSPWLLVALGVVGVLMVAQASATQADIVGIVAALALIGVTPAGVSGPPPPTGARGGSVLVALGDSYMSGEGASVYFNGTDDGGSDQCRRSPTSWAVMASHEPPFTGLLDLACSGATTLNVSRFPATMAKGTKRSDYIQAGESGTQLDQYTGLTAEYAKAHENFNPSLVVLSLGGNDAGFSTIGMMCVAPGDCKDKQSLWTTSLPEVKYHLEQTYDQIDAAFPGVPVVVAPYPIPIADEATCGDLALTRDERSFLLSFVTSLNTAVADAATDHGFYYLGQMATALQDANLQLCDPKNDGQPGLNFIGLRSVNGPAEQRFNPSRWSHSSFHPNVRGHAAMLTTFERWMADNHPTASGMPARLSAKAPEAVAPPAGECDVYADTSSGCRPQGMLWAERRIGFMLFPAGLLALLATVGAWWASVTFFAWRRRRTASG